MTGRCRYGAWILVGAVLTATVFVWSASIPAGPSAGSSPDDVAGLVVRHVREHAATSA